MFFFGGVGFWGMDGTYEEGDVEGSDEAEDVEEESDPRSGNTEHGCERQLLEAAASQLPRATVADVSEADGAPGEEGRETRKREEPVEDVTAVGGEADESEEAEGQGEGHGDPGTAVAVNDLEPAGSHAVQGQGLECARRAEGGGVGDGDDGEGDDGVHDGGEDLDLGLLEGADEGGVFGVGAGCLGQKWVVTLDDEAQDEEGDDVEERHTPEDLLGGLGERFARVVGLGGGKADELGSGEGEGGGHEDGAETLEAVLEGLLGSMPVCSADVSSVLYVSSGSGNRSSRVAGFGGTYLVSVETPPQLMMMPVRMKPMTAMTLIVPRTNSTSP